MKKALLIGLLASVSTAQAGTLTAKPSFPAYKPSPSSSHAPSAPAPSSSPMIGRNVPQSNTAASSSTATTHTATPSAPHTPAPAAAAPAPASSGMGGIVGGMAAGALLGAGATMLLSDSASSSTAPATGAGTSAPAGTVTGATIAPYSGNVEQDFMSGMLLWQNKNYAELINITNPYLACTNCSDKDKFMMELNRLGKLNVGSK